MYIKKSKIGFSLIHLTLRKSEQVRMKRDKQIFNKGFFLRKIRRVIQFAQISWECDNTFKVSVDGI